MAGALPTEQLQRIESFGHPTQNKYVEREGSAVMVYAGKSKAGCSAPDVEKINQDAYCAIEQYGDHPGLFWFSVMDGHGVNGHQVSDVVRRALPKNVQECPEFNKDMKQALEKGFFRTNCEVFQRGMDVMMSGTTCIACVVQGTTLYTANVGDSRAIMARSNGRGCWTAFALSQDHKPDRPDEEKRILANDGRVGALKGPNGEPLGPPRSVSTETEATALTDPGVRKNRRVTVIQRALPGVDLFKPPGTSAFCCSSKDSLVQPTSQLLSVSTGNSLRDLKG